jgi:hypothetical protein
MCRMKLSRAILLGTALAFGVVTLTGCPFLKKQESDAGAATKDEPSSTPTTKKTTKKDDDDPPKDPPKKATKEDPPKKAKHIVDDDDDKDDKDVDDEPEPNTPKKKVLKVFPQDKKAHPVPADWVRLVDRQRGFAFKVPKGTKHHTKSQNGVDVLTAQTPPPHAIAILSVAMKGAKTSLTNLKVKATDILTKGNMTEVKVEKTSTAPDYNVHEITCKFKGEKLRFQTLVASDGDDNYIVYVGVEDARYNETKDTVETIWQSFEMF